MQTKSLGTQFAPARRASLEQVEAEHAEVAAFSDLIPILDALPNVAAVLNEQRQIVYANKAFIEMVGAHSLQEILGTRTGEALACIHSSELDGGCGTSEACRYCGAVQAVLHAQALNERKTHECRITAQRDGHSVSLDLSVTAVPFRRNTSKYTIVTLKDISDEKRRRALEQIFFHDIINHAQSVAGVLSCAQDVASLEEVNQLLDLARMASVEMIDGILSQRDLLAAEHGEIRLARGWLSTRSELEECAGMLRHHFAASNRTLQIDPASADLLIETDETLLKRILTNMVKNALEATKQGGCVTIGCTRNEASVTFWAHNEGLIPRETELQIFQRSFSTKGPTRGLGTYSMKLLGERYLGGTVSFTTDKEEGTIFRLELPAAVIGGMKDERPADAAGVRL